MHPDNRCIRMLAKEILKKKPIASTETPDRGTEAQ